MKNRWLTALVRRYWSLTVVFWLALALETYNITAAAFWGDEASTVNASTRSIGALVKLVGHVDAVHMVYYFGMHFWLKVFGVNELSLRLPEAIAISVAAVFVFVILKKRTNLASAVVGTVCFAIMPRSMWVAGVGRSYAISILFGMVLTWLLLNILEIRAPRKIWFVAYAAVGALACNVFLYSALILMTHALVLLVLRSDFSKLWRFAVAVGAALLAATPVALMAQSQMYQIGWIPPESTDWFIRIFGRVLFDSDMTLTLVIWCLVTIGFLIFAAKAIWRVGKVEKPLLNLAVSSLMVALLPTIGGYIYALLSKPIFTGRYFSFSAGAVALLIGFAVYQLRFTLLRATALILIVAASIGPATFWRQEYRYGNDNNKVAGYIQANAHAGDAVFFVPNNHVCSGVCTASVGYASWLKGVTVIGLKNQIIDQGYLHDRFRSANQTALQAKRFKRIWVVQNTPGRPKTAKPYLAAIDSLGFKPSTPIQLKFETITLYSR